MSKMRVCQAISGAQRKRQEFRGFALSQSDYDAGTSLPKHYHENTVLSFAVRGGTTLRLARTSDWCDEECLLFLASGETHANAYPQPTSRLHIEVTPEFWTGAAGKRVPGRASGAVRHPIALELRSAALIAFSSGDDLARLGLALRLTDMIGVLGGAGTCPGTVSRNGWLLRLRDFLAAHCEEPLELCRLVEVAGRHPAHISRAFRRYFGKSITQFVRERRLQRAAELLRNEEAPLAQIALECGFCDQSHFTNVFRHYAGITPSRIRLRARDRG
jgi:AraC family transcriptional regulator